jgi:integrase
MREDDTFPATTPDPERLDVGGLPRYKPTVAPSSVLSQVDGSIIDRATFRRAIDAFLSQPVLSNGTRAKYRQTLEAIAAAAPGTKVSGPLLAAIVSDRWIEAAPRTWNRQVATIHSFLAFSERHDFFSLDPSPVLDRRREPEDQARWLPRHELERLWARRDIPLREKAFWRLLYETAARASEILRLDTEDLDIPNKRAQVRSKGGDIEVVHFQAGSARLLPRLLRGRNCGPVFLTDRRPIAAPATPDVCPVSGHARLSYRRAEELFRHYAGWTLHQLRHTAITDLAERNVELPLLMAKSRHKNLRTLQRYARPSVDAVAQLTADHDPARR